MVGNKIWMLLVMDTGSLRIERGQQGEEMPVRFRRYRERRLPLNWLGLGSSSMNDGEKLRNQDRNRIVCGP